MFVYITLNRSFRIEIVTVSFGIWLFDSLSSWNIVSVDFDISLHQYGIESLNISNRRGNYNHAYLWVRLWWGWVNFPRINCDLNLDVPDIQYLGFDSLMHFYQNHGEGWGWFDHRIFDGDLFPVDEILDKKNWLVRIFDKY